MEISVRAIPPPGNLYRRRAGRAWPAEAVIVKVVDHPAAADEISPLQYAELQADPHINAYPVGDPNAAPVLDAQAAVAQKDAEIAALRRELSSLAEIAEEEKRRVMEEAEVAGRKIVELQSEIDRLRTQIAKRKG